MLYIKRAGQILLFLAGLLLMLVIISAVVVPKDNTREAGIEHLGANGILAEPADTIDVLILGDSEPKSAITPIEIWREKGYTVFTIATHTQTLPYSIIMLERALKTQHPKLVIFETLAIYRKITTSDILINELGRYLPVFRYHSRWKSLHRNDFSLSKKTTHINTSKGYDSNKRIIPASTKSYMAYSDKAEEIKPVNKKYFLRIKKIVEESGAKLVLLSTPSTKNWNYRKHNGIQKLADEIGCEFIDLNLMTDQLGLDWEKDTRDKGDHLNYYGALKVTAFLSDYLESTGMLSDRREDPACKSWYEDAKSYDDEISRQ